MKVKCPMRKLGSMATLILIPATWLAPRSNFLVALISLSICNLVDLLIPLYVFQAVNIAPP